MADIRLKPDTTPVFKKSRPVPYALQKALDFELQCIQQQDILESSPWAMPLVVVPKTNGKLCVCGNYKTTINQYVEKSLPTAHSRKLVHPD